MRLAFLALLVVVALNFARADTLLALTPNVKDGGGEAEFKAMLEEQKRRKTDGIATSIKWSDMEREPGKIDLKKFTQDLQGAKMFGWKAALTIQTIDTIKRTVPKDLESEAWDSPKMTERFAALLRAISPLIDDNVVAVSLGNEVDGYLNPRPGEVAAYKAFLARGRKALRQDHPKLPVGVTCMFEGRREHSALVDGLFEGLDAVFFTYYPMGDQMAVRPTSTIAPDLATMVKVAAGRPLVLAEVGYAASPLLGSSDSKQAEFVRAFYKELAKQRSKVTLAAWFLQTDLSPSLVQTCIGYYGIEDPHFKAYLSTLGLRKSDGTARPALAAFEEAIKGFRASK